MMSRARWRGMAAVAAVVVWSGTSDAFAQSLLQRLAQQLEKNIPPAESLPAPRTQPEPPAASPGVPRAAAPPAVVPGSVASTNAPGSLGVRLAPLTDEAMRQHQLTVRQGALVTHVEPGSAAEAAGLPVGAAIVALDGRRVDTPAEVAVSLRRMAAGDRVEVTYYDRDRLLRKRITLGAAPGAPSLLPLSESARAVPTTPPSTSSAVPVPPQPAADGRVPVLPSLDGAPAGPLADRPLLGRLGRILENVVAPAQATEPAVPLEVGRVPGDMTTASLQRQVEALRAQVERLQRQVWALEQRLNASSAPAVPPPPP
ncbi:MAG: PDZ domain-containing protein [Pirellulaceae bacterium]